RRLDLFGDQGVPVALDVVVQAAHVGAEVDAHGVGEDGRAGLQGAMRSGGGAVVAAAAAAERSSQGVLDCAAGALVVLGEVGTRSGGQRRFDRRLGGLWRGGQRELWLRNRRRGGAGLLLRRLRRGRGQAGLL